MPRFNESTVEEAALEWLSEIGYATYTETDFKSGQPPRERTGYDEAVLSGRLSAALGRLNPHIPPAHLPAVVEDALRKIGRGRGQNVLENSHAFHRLLVEGVDVAYREGRHTRHEKLWLVDAAQPENNDWLAVNQFTLTDVNLHSRARTNRRPDVVLFVNGLPLAVIELKNPGDENATLRRAYNQLQTYQADIPGLFTYAGLLVISDGVEARLGTTAAGWEFFKPWRTIDGFTLDPAGAQLETLLKGACHPARLLDVLLNFTVFEHAETHLIRKLAGYHQYHAVNKALEKTLLASQGAGDQRAGVIWHTQGSGKSLSMLFYAGKLIGHPAMHNPTLIILTDRNDLDDQLFGTFAAGHELLRQEPIQAEGRDHLRDLLRVASGGVIFTTIQKFMPTDDRSAYPLLSERRNIVFIADEAHRSQYGLDARVNKASGEVSYGFAKYVRDALPNASFIGFTGTPVETTDANTRSVFGDYIDIYDIQRAVDDGATVPIFYEARLARLNLREELRPRIDPDFEDITEGEEETVKERLKTRWSQLEAMVGTSERVAALAQDIVTHFEQRTEALAGKGMIVCMSRRIAVALYDALVALRPDWHTPGDADGALKVIMTGSAGDPPEYQPHVRTKPRRKALAERFKNPDDPLRLVIVRDMWLTGFDAPSLHTMYIDKPMRGHGLMQAIARVNRVYLDKPGGLIVDYLGIATELQQAIQTYTSAHHAAPAQVQEEAVLLMHDFYGIVAGFFHRFDYRRFFTGTPAERLSLIPAALEHILSQEDGKKRFIEHVARLSKAFALAMPHEDALAIREEVAFFQMLRAVLVKHTPVDARTQEEIHVAVKQLVSEAVISQGVMNIFEVAGLPRPDVAVLSDAFLEEVRHLPQRHLALELLRKLLNDQIKSRAKSNVVLGRSFADLLEKTIRRYQNRTIDAAQVVAELIEMAKDIREAAGRGEALGLTEDEMAFYDALADHQTAVAVMGDKQLAVIALELVRSVRANVTLDWTVRQNARAKLRVLVKRVLRHYGYPPDLEDSAADLVMEQAELLAAQWLAAHAA